MVFTVFCMIMLSYFVGAFPTGFLWCKLFFKRDITLYGSGNCGATNVARVLGGVQHFFLIFFIDALKAWLMLYGVHVMLNNVGASEHKTFVLFVCAIALLLGNTCSVFMGFKGGKGVATFAGLITQLLPCALIGFFIMTWLVVTMITRHVFIGSLSSSLLLLIAYPVLYGVDASFYFLLCATLWIVIRHKKNLQDYFYASLH